MTGRPRPLQPVVSAILREGTAGVFGYETRTARWWEMMLACGHKVERSVKYRPVPPGERGWRRSRSLSDVLPAPKRARCDTCGPTCAGS